MNRIPNLAALIATRRSRAEMSVRLGQSPLGSLLLSDKNTAYTDMTSLFLTAFCAYGENSYDGWISSHGLIALAEYVFHHSLEYRNLEEDMKEALVYGALIAMWTIPQDTKFDQTTIDRARAKIISIVKTRHPPQSLIKQALKGWVQCLQVNDSETRHRTLSHLFPGKLSTGWNSRISALLKQNCYIGDEHVEFPIPTNEDLNDLLSPKIESDIANIWPTLSDRSIVSFFHTLGSNTPNIDCTFIAAMFTMTATISKTSFTDQWITSRWNNLKEEVPQLSERDAVSRVMLENFERIFQRSNKTVELKVNSLLVSSWLANGVGLESVNRIVSQARAPHVSGLTALCDLTLKYDSITFTTLSSTFGSHQVKNIITLAFEIIHNPYCTLIGPPVVVASYADIAFIATEIAFNINGPQRRGAMRYISPAEKAITKTKTYLIAYATKLVENQTINAEYDSADKALLKAYGFDLISQTENDLTISPSEKKDTFSTFDHGQTQPKQKVSKSEFISFLSSLKNDNDKAFIRIMEKLSECIAMSTLPTLDGATSISDLVTTTALPSELKEFAQLLGVPWNLAWDTSKSLIMDNLYTTYKVPTHSRYASVHLQDTRPINADDQAPDQE